ncbi:MAG: MBL fold metallo-hydrolase [Eubacteriales bacterium]|nr:MBL fold metallo-hydrolase [Eubacteriales bacterium]
MKLTYLGTAAAEGWPAVFCNCEYCLKAKERGGKNIRTRSQALINDNLLLDFPMDANMHMLSNKLDLSSVESVFFTHSHLDHCSPIDLFFHAEGCYAHNLSKKSMTLYGNKKVGERIGQFVRAYEEERFGLEFCVIAPYIPIVCGDYTVTPLRANHSSGEEALVYIIQENGKTLLYLHDTGMPYEDVYEYLINNRIQADFVSYDCTYVTLPSGGGHLGLDSCQVLRDKFLAMGIIDENTVNCINHFSHNGKLIHDELVPVAEEMGFITAYDGMVIEF